MYEVRNGESETTFHEVGQRSECGVSRDTGSSMCGIQLRVPEAEVEVR
jgi:hypothetical protein